MAQGPLALVHNGTLACVSALSPLFQISSSRRHQARWHHSAEMGAGVVEVGANSKPGSWAILTTPFPGSLLSPPQVGGDRVCRLGA